MRLNEVGNEFENIKHNTAATKYKFAERKRSSYTHQLEVAKHVIATYKDRMQFAENFKDATDEEKVKGFVSFHTQNWRGDLRYAVYHSLTPRDITILTAAYKRASILFHAIEKLNKGMSTLKRNAAKQAGTFVSKQDLIDYQKVIADQLKNVLEKTSSDIKVETAGSRSRQNGSSHIYLRIKDTANPGNLEKADKPKWKAFIDQLKLAMLTWLNANDFINYVSMRFEHDSTYPSGGVAVKQRAGVLDVTIESKDVIAYYRKHKV